MKIQKVKYNNHRQGFEVTSRGSNYFYPFALLRLQPSRENVIREVHIDRTSGKQSFTYMLQSGDEGTVHIDHVLDYNFQPANLRKRVLGALTDEARQRIKESVLSKRALVRRLGTSASQLYRLLDPNNQSKSIDRVLDLLEVLECDAEIKIKDREKEPAPLGSDGVDVTLIHWMLSLTPVERLRILQQHVNSVLRLRDE
jgi:hypothetical protein